MATTVQAADTPDATRRVREVNPTVVTVAGSTVAILVSLFILNGQTAARIDGARMELQTSIDSTRAELRTELLATSARVDSASEATNARVDRVLEILAGGVADDIEALREAVEQLADP